MALRQVTLTTSRTQADGTQDLDLLRLVECSMDTVNKVARYAWCVGKLDGSSWSGSANPADNGWKEYRSKDDLGNPITDWDDLLAEGAASANQHEAQQDKVLNDLQTANAWMAGAKSSY